jgi:hypothetical protein
MKERISGDVMNTTTKKIRSGAGRKWWRGSGAKIHKFDETLHLAQTNKQTNNRRGAPFTNIHRRTPNM